MGEQASTRRLTPVSIPSVRVRDGFWAPRMDVNREVTLPMEYQQCKKTGRIDALKLNWRPGMPGKPHIFWDSDLAKWLEAVAYTLAGQKNRRLERMADRVI
ncbi:MAG: beta-L-arabinofuranosidase domain-containing protein, partial [Planctomycetota bacterium]